MISGFFQTVRRMRDAWKRGNICSASVFFVRVGSKISPRRAKNIIQISPPLGEQDRSNALPQGQQRQSNPHPMPCLSPRRHGNDKCILPAVEMSRRNSSIGVSPSVFSLIGTICPTNVVLFKETICSKNLVKITPQDCKIKVHFRLTWVALNYPVYSRTLPLLFSDFFWEDGAAVP